MLVASDEVDIQRFVMPLPAVVHEVRYDKHGYVNLNYCFNLYFFFKKYSLTLCI